MDEAKIRFPPKKKPSHLIKLSQFQSDAVSAQNLSETLISNQQEPISLEDCTLESLLNTRAPLKKKVNISDYQNIIEASQLSSFNPENYDQVSETKQQRSHAYTPTSTLPPDPISPTDLILTFSFSHPKMYHRGIVARFEILGSQSLTKLRDAFYCFADFCHFEDYPQNNPNTLTTKTSSSYFFIENVFYNDFRFEEAIDMSEPIINWINQEDRSKQKWCGLSDFKSATMSDYKWNDLTLRINYPYLLMHQGDCGHNFTLDDVRLIHPLDSQNKSLYPKTIFHSFAFRKKCGMCEKYCSRFVTFNDVLAPENPMFWCFKCHDQFHFDKDGRPIYSDYSIFKFNHFQAP